MRKWFRRLSRIALLFIFLVMLAGSVVRMTGSGMGCPDWPKCFGYLIPPTERSQLEWAPEKDFQKGQIIIVTEELLVAEGDFTTGPDYQAENWAPYTKHDYAVFNPFHTWIEYINRLFGALSGLPMLILVISGIYYVKRDWRMLALAIVGMVLLGFEAWLGKLVVDGNLIPGSITMHMMGALCVVAVLLVILGLNTDFDRIPLSRSFNAIVILAIIMSVIQIVIGTQIREQVDLLHEAGISRNNWIGSLNWQFYFHRSFSLMILATNSWLWWQNRRKGIGIAQVNAIMLLIFLEIIIGMVLSYLNMPKLAQPTHLLIGAFMLALQFYVLIRIVLSDKKKITSFG